MEIDRWNLGELREHIRQLPGDQRQTLAFVSSMDWSDRIFRYHFCEARDALRAIPIDEDPNSINNLELVFFGNGEHDRNILVIRANTIACIYTVRNAYDHLAQICNSLLISPPISIDKCDFFKVRDRLADSELKNELVSLSESHWFKYIAAYSNTSKHRALVQQSMHLSFVDGIAGIRTEEFTHDQRYSATMVGDLLEGVLAVKNKVISCGQALNKLVVKANG